MELKTTLILLLHPLAALAVIWFMLSQHRYRKRRTEVSGDEFKKARLNHEETGERLYRAAIAVVALAFCTNLLLTHDEGAMALLPNHIHGWFGLLGLILLTILVRKGRLTKEQREAQESFSMEMQRHGRASDVVVILMLIHAFLGFLYLFQLLTR